MIGTPRLQVRTPATKLHDEPNFRVALQNGWYRDCDGKGGWHASPEAAVACFRGANKRLDGQPDRRYHNPDSRQSEEE